MGVVYWVDTPCIIVLKSFDDDAAATDENKEQGRQVQFTKVLYEIVNNAN